MRALIYISLTSAFLSGTLLDAAISTLSLSNGAAARGQNASLPLTFFGSGNEISGLEWDLTYSTTDFSAVTVSLGPAATDAVKGIVCASPAVGRYKCLLIGLNSTVLGDGLVATATLTVSSNTTNSFSSVSLASLSTDGLGLFHPIDANTATVGIIQPGTLLGLTCSPADIAPPETTLCTVSLAAAAPSGGISVALGYISAGATLSLPRSTLVSEGTTQASFSLQAASTNWKTTAKILATLNGSTKSFSLGIEPR